MRVLDTEGEAQVSMAETPAAGVAVDAVLDAQVARSDAVLVGLPRLAFLTSDVVVLVTTHSLLSARVYARILSWAQVASGGVMLAARAPALVLVCNQLGNVVHPNGAVLREEAQLDVAAATKAFLRQHERGDSAFRPSSLLAASSRQHNPQQPRLGAFFRSVSVIHIPLAPAPPAAPPPHPLVAELASRQLGRFQAEVFRLAAAAQGGAGAMGADGGGKALTEREWCGMWRSAVPLWKDASVSAAEVRALAAARGGGGGGASAEATVEAVNKAKRVFDFAGLASDGRRFNPCPGHTPPKRVMHLLHAAAAEVAVRALAVLCCQAQDARGAGVDRAAALRALLQHIGGALPCAAADPFPQSGGFDRDQTACSKCRADYDGAPFHHHRPVTKERPGADSDARRQAAKRLMAHEAMLGQVQLYTELETQPVTGASLVPLQVTACTNVAAALKAGADSVAGGVASNGRGRGRTLSVDRVCAFLRQ